MYDDGPGSGNLVCVPANMTGCWGHRDNILGDYGPALARWHHGASCASRDDHDHHRAAALPGPHAATASLPGAADGAGGLSRSSFTGPARAWQSG